MLALTVTHHDVEFVLRRLQRQLQQSGLLRELRRQRQYEKSSEWWRRCQREGIRQTRTRARLAHGERSAHPSQARGERRDGRCRPSPNTGKLRRARH